MASKRSETEQDKLCIAAWQELLAEFKGIEKHYATTKDNSALIQLKEKAKNNPYLTYRQLDGIYARRDNVMNGTYGQSKTQANLNYQNKS